MIPGDVLHTPAIAESRIVRPFMLRIGLQLHYARFPLWVNLLC